MKTFVTLLAASLAFGLTFMIVYFSIYGEEEE